jgi:ribonuclease P protein component
MERLRRAEDFKRLREEGQVFRHSFVVLSLAANGLPHNRYGFITPKRLGNAVKRNRIRRLFRESVRLLHLKLTPGYDVIFIARYPGVGQPFASIQDAVHKTLERAGLIVNEETQ